MGGSVGKTVKKVASVAATPFTLPVALGEKAIGKRILPRGTNPIDIAKDIGKVGKVPQADFTSADELLRRQKELEQQEKVKREALAKRIRANLEKEEQSKLALSEQRFAREDVLEAELSKRLGDIGIQAEETREDVAEAFAERGLGRSSFAQSGLGRVTLEEQRLRAEERGRTEQEKEQARLAEAEIKEEIRQRREQTELELEFADLSQLVQSKQFFNQAAIQQRFDIELANVQLKSQQRQGLLAAAGGLAGNIARILSF